MLTTDDARARYARPRGRRATLLGLVTAALALSFTAAANARPPDVGTLTAMSGTSGCQMVVGGSLGCTPAAGLAGAEDVTVSPDGRNVYVTSYTLGSPNAPNGLAAFSRDRVTGALTQLPGTTGCMTPHGDSAGTIPHHGRLPVGRYTETLIAKRNKLHSAPKTLRFTIVA